jgi:holo-[acyl-carrier protein] synthase
LRETSRSEAGNYGDKVDQEGSKVILGLGTDLVEIARIQRVRDRHGERFEHRILTDAEFREYRERDGCVAYLAKRFAVKEAVAKALGTGMRGSVQWSTIQVLSGDLGRPECCLLGEAANFTQGKKVSVTITDERAYALAFAIYHNE